MLPIPLCTPSTPVVSDTWTRGEPVSTLVGNTNISYRRAIQRRMEEVHKNEKLLLFQELLGNIINPASGPKHGVSMSPQVEAQTMEPQEDFHINGFSAQA